MRSQVRIPLSPPNESIEYRGELAQLGARRVRNAEVRGSIPLFSTRETDKFLIEICLFLFALASYNRDKLLL
jgi:hypothetical protein